MAIGDPPTEPLKGYWDTWGYNNSNTGGSNSDFDDLNKQLASIQATQPPFVANEYFFGKAYYAKVLSEIVHSIYKLLHSASANFLMNEKEVDYFLDKVHHIEYIVNNINDGSSLFPKKSLEYDPSFSKIMQQNVLLSISCVHELVSCLATRNYPLGKISPKEEEKPKKEANPFDLLDLD